jgi:N-acetylneuraminic acid mutarotase
MKYFTLVFLTITLFTSCNDPYTRIEWNEKAELLNKYRNGSATACNGEIYYMGGYCEFTSMVYENSNYAYSPKKNEWIKKASMPTGRPNFALVSDSEYIYAIGGDPFSNKNERYDPKSDSWTILEPMITPRQHINGIMINNKIYIIGGLINLGTTNSSSWTYSNVTDKNEVYDTKTNKWEELAPMPSRRHNAFLATTENKILVFGGMGVEDDMWKSIDTVEEYNIDQNTWTTKGKMPQPLDGFGIYSFKQKIYIIGGFSGSVIQNSVFIYDPQKDTWIKSNKFPHKKNGSSGYAGIDNKVYIIGGCDENYTSNSYNFVGKIY